MADFLKKSVYHIPKILADERIAATIIFGQIYVGYLLNKQYL